VYRPNIASPVLSNSQGNYLVTIPLNKYGGRGELRVGERKKQAMCAAAVGGIAGGKKLFLFHVEGGPESRGSIRGLKERH